MRHTSEMEEPKEVVDDHHDARSDECERRERHQWPTHSEVLEVDQMARDREEDEVPRQRVEEVQKDVE